VTIEEIEKEIESLKAEVSSLDAKQGEIERNQQRFQDASVMLIELARKAQRRAAEQHERLEELKRQDANFLEFAKATDGRLDGLEGAQAHSEGRLDALINAQIRTDEQLAKLGAHVDDLTAHTKASFTQLEAFIAETARQVRALVERRNGNGGAAE
jgi:chromosome segregation ATPase